ncbi:SDR family oxidoreductase [Kribbella sp. NBC_01245]|uniref:SDR family oxidoreductase n=1 Tax=Kribbella sp. NBC_01245 TaxID=2903578 RepID=UPI002E2817D0|nr:SDR family oxidoreductase [Kribbella sp. NBC_01245]
MILIAGGTGRLGSQLANALCRRDFRVRVMSRGLSPHADRLDEKVEVVHGDIRDPADLVTAMDGVELVVSAVQGFAGPGDVSPESVDRDGNINLIEAAEKQGAAFVLVSVLGAATDSRMELFRMKYAAEQRLRAGSCQWTIVRPEASAETWANIIEQTAGKSGRPLVFGRGDAPISWVSVQDVAALVERAVLDESLRNRVLEISGPEPATLMELAKMVMVRQGWTGSPRRVPRPMLHVMANTVGRLRPEMDRQARASLAMDNMPTHRSDVLRAEFPDLPCTPVSAVIAQL